MTLISGYIFYYYQSKSIREDFISNHNSIANVIANNLKQAENLTDQMMLNTAYGLEDIVSRGVPSKKELQRLRDQFKVTDFYIISNTGKFLKSTDDFAETTDFNFFNFCSSYKNLVDRPFLVDQTPILLAHPPNNNKPYKFTHLTSRDKKYIIEVGIHLEYIQNILKSSLSSYPSIKQITLKTPADQVLGQINSNKSSGDFLKITKEVEANDSQCCQCKTKKLTSGNYFYRLEFDVSTSEMNKALNRIFEAITFVIFVLVLLSLIFSRIISKSILKKFESLSLALDTITATGDLNQVTPQIKDKDLDSISQSFNRMIKNLVEKENKLIESEKLKTYYNLSNQVAHDIRSPLEMLKGLKEDTALLPEDARRRIQLGINRIEEITFNLLKANKKQDADSKEVQTQELLSLGLSILTEKRIEYQNKERIQLIDSFDDNSFGLFSKVNRSVLKSILSNLINNSVEAIGNNEGLIEISLFATDSHNIFKVIDSGPGIPEEIASKLFTKGFTSKASGNGLGLYNAKQDLEALGGAINFESQIGKGTTFTISLPKSEMPQSFINAINAYKYDRIIVLDDDPAFHDVWKNRLQEVESKVEHIFSVKEMLTKYKGLHPKILLLSDFELMDDEFDGIDLINKLNHKEHSILVTARSEESEIQDRCIKSGIKLLPKSLVNYVMVRMTGMPRVTGREGIGEGQACVEIVQHPIILIDDDKLVHINWAAHCKKKGIPFIGFRSIDEFIKASENLDKGIRIFIDSNLGDGIKGEIESEKIFNLGFKNLYLATGYQKEDITKPEYIIQIFSKNPDCIGE
jgi:signal transduction histidine kinase/CheY-like chemotaxis protein/arsenate reductase-like glutaredoxin family protein